MLSLADRAIVRVQSSLARGDHYEPEPDIAVVTTADSSTEHPSTAILVIEVATSSLRQDRRIKAPLYARASIPEFWLIDVTTRRIEVHRDPRSTEFATVATRRRRAARAVGLPRRDPADRQPASHATLDVLTASSPDRQSTRVPPFDAIALDLEALTRNRRHPLNSPPPHRFRRR